MLLTCPHFRDTVSFFISVGMFAGRDGGVRSDPALQPAAQQAHVLAHSYVCPMGPPPHRQVSIATYIPRYPFSF